MFVGRRAMIDPLSEALRSVRLLGGVFLDVRMTAPWAVISGLTADDCRPLLQRPAQLIFYHVILHGRCQLWIENEPPLEVTAGEVVLLPHNDTHTLASGPGLEPVEGRSLVRPSADGGLARVVHGGGGELTHMVCGFLGSEDVSNPLLSTLPRALKIDMREGTARDWVEASVRFAATELAAGRLASSGIMSRLSEVLLVEAVRQYAAALGEGDVGWMKGFSDPQIGRALAAIHKNLAAPWSAESLAKEVALSRSGFMERFTALVGMPPIRYLTVWRMRTARQLLRETRTPVNQLAHAVGYESEEAFSRAFKREYGLSPSHWRDQQADGQ